MYKAMLVDDEYMILEGLKQIIPWQDLGFEIVKTARTGREALDYLKEQPVDLIISDITMPELSGIQMISEAYALGYDFSAVFLSGYQEFEYVKEGIRLGVKDYLVKPVDKEELTEIVKKIRQELDDKQYRKEQEQLYTESSISRWLNDELSEHEFFELMDNLMLKTTGPYTAVKVTGTAKELLLLMKELKLKGQKLLITSGPQQDQQLTIIFQGATSSFKLFLADLKRRFNENIIIYPGETVQDWENVYESYEKVLQIEELNQFYPELLPSQHLDMLEEMTEPEFSFFGFNKSLMIGDAKTIQQELDKIFAEVQSQHLRPENARYIAFLLFADISRQYPVITKAVYEATIQKIRSSTTLYQLKKVLEELLQLVSEQPVEKQLSEVSQQVIEIVRKKYKQELNLKNVADELHLNAVYLGQLFKKELHSSFAQYLNQVRIKRAQQLLLYSNQNINEIAEAIGYNNTNYFSKMFKKLNGITPKEFREQYLTDYSEVKQEGKWL
ncbi:response regulator transcription factor [Enterococcus sp. LJL90]